MTGGATQVTAGPNPPPSAGAFVGVNLMFMSFASGCMDILSFRELGQVFTSAMTGNLALLGLSLGQGDLAAMSRSMAAFIGFLTGLLLGTALLRGQPQTLGWSRAMTRALLAEEALLLAFAAIWHIGEGPSSGGLLYSLIALSAIAMGMQSIVAHHAGMSGITTTYFTGTLTRIVIGTTGRTTHRAAVEQRQPHRMRWSVSAFPAYVAGAALTSLLLLKQGPAPTSAPAAALPAVAIAGVLLVTLANDARGMLRAKTRQRRI